MISSKKIEEVKQRLIDVYKPLKIYLFGSYAWGRPTKDSDLDLLIVVEKSTEKSYKRAIAGHHALFGLEISKDIIVYTKDEFDARINDVSSLCYKVGKEGKVIYAKA